LINRTVEKIGPLAEEIERAFPRRRPVIGSFEPDALKAQLAESDLIVNCTSLGMKPDDASPVSPELLENRHCLYDTIYTAARTPLMRAGDQVGARSANGLTMLLHQGALAFEIWFQREAPVEVMRQALLAVAPR
jgi:shikimate dehydrogenase